jgi:hypothetical protein
MTRTRIGLFIAVVAGFSLTGCTNLIRPVAPWERGNLAADVMVNEPMAPQAAVEEHVYASKEGTMGGYGKGGGGCGCN